VPTEAAPTSTTPPPEPIRVACVGDSITEGFAASEPMLMSYPAQLQRMLGPGYRVMNFGHSGAALVRHAYYNNSYWDTQTFRESLKSDPDIVVIMLGTNDAGNETWARHAQDFMPTYAELIDAYERLGRGDRPRVLVAVPPPLYVEGVYGFMQQRVINEQYPELIPKIARQNKLSAPAISVHEVFQRHCPVKGDNTTCNWISDGVHPNDAGYLVIARTMMEAIVAAMQASPPDVLTDPWQVFMSGLANSRWAVAAILATLVLSIVLLILLLSSGTQDELPTLPKELVGCFVCLGCCEAERAEGAGGHSEAECPTDVEAARCSPGKGRSGAGVDRVLAVLLPGGRRTAGGDNGAVAYYPLKSARRASKRGTSPKPLVAEAAAEGEGEAPREEAGLEAGVGSDSRAPRAGPEAEEAAEVESDAGAPGGAASDAPGPGSGEGDGTRKQGNCTITSV